MPVPDSSSTFHIESRVRPTGVTTPIPVTTTRRLMILIFLKKTGSRDWSHSSTFRPVYRSSLADWGGYRSGFGTAGSMPHLADIHDPHQFHCKDKILLVSPLGEGAVDMSEENFPISHQTVPH